MSEETAVTQEPKIVTGFAVLIDENGEVMVERNPGIFVVKVDRGATLLEVRRYASEIVMDLQAQAAAEYVAIAAKKES